MTSNDFSLENGPIIGPTSPSSFAPFLGSLGLAFALGLTCMSLVIILAIGAAYGTAKAGIGIMSVGIMRPELIMRSILPIVMAGMIPIYGVVVNLSILKYCKIFYILKLLVSHDYSMYMGSIHLAAGLCVGLSGLAAGMAIGIVGDAGVRAFAQQPRLFIGMVIVLIFSEVLGIYGFIISLMINFASDPSKIK